MGSGSSTGPPGSELALPLDNSIDSLEWPARTFWAPELECNRVTWSAITREDTRRRRTPSRDELRRGRGEIDAKWRREWSFRGRPSPELAAAKLVELDTSTAT
ncbi:hypothetical protein DPEC_G00236570 [Dallia pectoralis]|uniref:Uncharacterized protein n=1 Tax=Dallia pectoralis TaxID=75939 RepID=A0ACC2FYF2_DALPE|nr:hypothetical protein DPEC_G00236570 [Dallia pectoralis]